MEEDYAGTFVGGVCAFRWGGDEKDGQLQAMARKTVLALAALNADFYNLPIGHFQREFTTDDLAAKLEGEYFITYEKV